MDDQEWKPEPRKDEDGMGTMPPRNRQEGSP